MAATSKWLPNGVRFGTGHVVIQAKGYQDTGSQELLLPAQVVSTIEEFLHTEAMKHVVRGVSPRLLASGLLSSAANAAGVRIMGVIPQEERTVSLIPQRIVEGTYLNDDTAIWRCHWRRVGPQARGEDRVQSSAHDSGAATAWYGSDGCALEERCRARFCG